MRRAIPVVDIFAGPGGLGEGFSSLGHDVFKIAISAETDPSAHQTLQLRAFFRGLDQKQRKSHYYPFVQSGGTNFCPDGLPARGPILRAWRAAEGEARRLTLGNEKDDEELAGAVRKIARSGQPWVLIGGPPCQAYSLAGRVRNRGKKDYVPENDNRHFLYEHYLRLLRKFGPAVFVMENVKGILSSQINGSGMFDRILSDLSSVRHGGRGYVLKALSGANSLFGNSPGDYVVRTEDFGIPQARHRVIIVGVREDLARNGHEGRLTRASGEVWLDSALSGLPRLRSTLSEKGAGQSKSEWVDAVTAEYRKAISICRAAGHREIAHHLVEAIGAVKNSRLEWDGTHQRINTDAARRRAIKLRMPRKLADHLFDSNIQTPLNHQARGHMSADLGRYGYAAAFLRVNSRSPMSREFPDALAPAHANWESGHFADRFRVQSSGAPSSTVTSHISKDGHHFIHWDPVQCRSFTVREAARAQTFPDNYYFLGNRTQQYVQVGNAVPPFLARQIAEVVRDIIR